jgi:lipopolysaccharide export system protein LptA
MGTWRIRYTGAVLLVFVLALAAWGEKVRLSADTMRYEPGEATFSVEGDVRILRGESLLTADRGSGKSDGSFFELEGSVTCEMPERELRFSCEKIFYYPREASRIEAFGKVEARQGENLFRASEILWRLGDIPHYTASGDVYGAWGDRNFEAGLATRKGDQFWVKKMRRFEDARAGVRIQAPVLEGQLQKDEVVEIIASGGVVMETLGARGTSIRITGQKCVYSLARGTLVVSGGAYAQQGDRTMKAESLVLRLDTRVIEAKGQPQLVFTVGD